MELNPPLNFSDSTLIIINGKEIIEEKVKIMFRPLNFYFAFTGMIEKRLIFLIYKIFKFGAQWALQVVVVKKFRHVVYATFILLPLIRSPIPR